MDRILIIDDDTALTDMLAECLQAEGFVVETVCTAEPGIEKALLGGFSLLILDIMLPGLSGFEALIRLRQQSPVPVLMLTARGDPVDRVMGLQMGADDYLPKPFNERELVARIRAILRRARCGNAPTLVSSRLVVDDCSLDPHSREVRRQEQVIELTTVEFDVLRVLLSRAGEAVSREDLVTEGLSRSYSVFDRSIDNHVSSLRRKLGPRPGNRERIKTLRGSGYLYATGSGEAIAKRPTR